MNNLGHVGNHAKTVVTPSYWVKPPSGCVKCNMDTTFSNEMNVMGVGMCLRDDSSHFLLAKTHRSSPLLLVHEREALGF